MNQFIRRTFEITALAAVLTLSANAANTPAGYIDFGKLSASASGGDFVEVNVSNGLIAMAARLVEKAEPKVAELLSGLHSVRVNVIGLDDDNRAEMQKRIQSIRAELDSQKWERLVTAKKGNEDVGVYIKTRGSEAVEGIVVTVIEGDREAVLVNIVGNIRPEKIALLGERLHIEPLKKIGESLEKK